MPSNRTLFDYIQMPIVLALIGITFFSGYHFFYTNAYNDSLSDTNNIAQLSTYLNTVKKKGENVVAWIDIVKNGVLANNDQIYTHSNSSVTINFFNGNSINLSENTLVKLEQSGINVEKGILDIVLSKNNPSLSFYIKGKEYKLKSLGNKKAKIKIIRTKNKSDIISNSGSVEVSSGISKKTINKNQIFSYQHDKNKETINEIKISSISPTQNFISYSYPPHKVLFKWQSSLKKAQYKLNVSKTIDFKKIISKKKIKTNKAKLSLKMPGRYYWQVISTKNKKHYSSTVSSFVVQDKSPLKLFTPYEQEYFIIKERVTPLKHYSIHFNWEERETSEYILELNFNNSNKIFKTEDNRFSIDLIKHLNDENDIFQTYKWRIREDRKDATWSKLQSFRIVLRKKPNGPTLVRPRNFHKTTHYFPDHMKYNFKWKPDSYALEYQLEISKDQHFKDIILSEIIEKNKFKWDTNKYGNYFWHVKSIFNKDDTSKFSNPFKFSAILEDVEFKKGEGIRFELKRPDQKIKFEWKGPKKKKNTVYIFELSSKQNFSKIDKRIKSKTKFVEFGIPKTGIFYWRTKQLYKNKKTRFTKPKQITVVPAPPPSTPVLAPEKEIEIQIRRNQSSMNNILKKCLNFIFPPVYAEEAKTFVKIKWLKNPDAKKYILEIYQDNKLENQILRQELGHNFFEWDNPKIGEYYWRISIIDFWNRQTQYSNISKLKVVFPKKYKKLKIPQLIIPKHNSITQRGKKETILFKWKHKDNFSKNILYRVEFAKTLSFKKIEYFEETENNFLKITPVRLKRLKKFYWRIKAVDNIFYRYSKSKRRRIIVKAPSPLAKQNSSKELSNDNIKIFKPHIIFGQAPTITSYQQTDKDFNAIVSGTALMSFNLSLASPISTRYMGELEISRQTGKVYKDQSYQSKDILLKLGRNSFYSNSWVHTIFLGFHQNSITTYELSNETSMSSSNESFTGLHLGNRFFFRSINNNYHKFDISFSALNMTKIKVAYNYNYVMGKKWAISAGPSYIKSSYTGKTSEISKSEIQLFVGIDFFPRGASNR